MTNVTARATNDSPPIEMVYTNWRGVTATRLIWPINLWFGSTTWHTEEQWFLKAIDIEKSEERDFAMCCIQSFSYLPRSGEPTE